MGGSINIEVATASTGPARWKVGQVAWGWEFDELRFHGHSGRGCSPAVATHEWEGEKGARYMERKGYKPKAWHERKRRRTLKRSQLRRARKEAERARRSEGGRKGNQGKTAFRFST